MRFIPTVLFNQAVADGAYWFFHGTPWMGNRVFLPPIHLSDDGANSPGRFLPEGRVPIHFPFFHHSVLVPLLVSLRAFMIPPLIPGIGWPPFSLSKDEFPSELFVVVNYFRHVHLHIEQNKISESLLLVLLLRGWSWSFDDGFLSLLGFGDEGFR